MKLRLVWVVSLWLVDSVLLEIKEVYLPLGQKPHKPEQDLCWAMGRNFTHGRILETSARIRRMG